jgi:hypothetical protein
LYLLEFNKIQQTLTIFRLTGKAIQQFGVFFLDCFAASGSQ